MDPLEHLLSFTPQGNLSDLEGVTVEVTLSGLDLVALIQSLKAGYKGFQDDCSTRMLAAVVASDWDAIEGRRAYWLFGKGHFSDLAGRLLELAEKIGMVSKEPSVGDWLEGLAREVGQS